MVGWRVAERLLHDATEGAAAVGGALYFDESTDDRPTAVRGSWDGQAELVVPLRTGSREFGRLALGRRRTGAGYGERERDSLQRAADAVAQALSLANLGAERSVAD
jgi:GAF domain-containing protein